MHFSFYQACCRYSVFLSNFVHFEFLFQKHLVMTKMKPLKQTTISTLTFVMITRMATAFVYCPEGESCRPCSQCPENQIVRETCAGTRDTVCGPFTEFKLFPAKGHAMLRDGLENRSNKAYDISKDSDVDGAESESWQTVTIVMVCVLAVTGVLFVVLVVITCHLCRRQNKEALLSQTDPGMCGYFTKTIEIAVINNFLPKIIAHHMISSQFYNLRKPPRMITGTHLDINVHLMWFQVYKICVSKLMKIG